MLIIEPEEHRRILKIESEASRVEVHQRETQQGLEAVQLPHLEEMKGLAS